MENDYCCIERDYAQTLTEEEKKNHLKTLRDGALLTEILFHGDHKSCKDGEMIPEARQNFSVLYAAMDKLAQRMRGQLRASICRDTERSYIQVTAPMLFITGSELTSLLQNWDSRIFALKVETDESKVTLKAYVNYYTSKREQAKVLDTLTNRYLPMP